MQQQPIMGLAPETPTCEMSLEELLLHALIMEREAVQRYEQLARMMECVGNAKVAKIFAKMSKIEAKHVTQIEEQIGDHALPILTPSEFRWRGMESPENADSGRVYQLMTPTQAMMLALDCEKHAFDFFDDVVEDSTDEYVREVAAEFAAEEKQHVAWVQEWLADL
jgi:rubrerythrin